MNRIFFQNRSAYFNAQQGLLIDESVISNHIDAIICVFWQFTSFFWSNSCFLSDKMIGTFINKGVLYESYQ